MIIKPFNSTKDLLLLLLKEGKYKSTELATILGWSMHKLQKNLESNEDLNSIDKQNLTKLYLTLCTKHQSFYRRDGKNKGVN